MFDPIAATWITMTIVIGSYGLYLIITENETASQLYVYGKSLDLKNKSDLFWKIFLVPKRYFSHFYITASLLFSLSCAIILLHHTHPISYIQSAKNYVQANFLAFKFETAQTLEVVTSLFFTVILMTIQSWRRLHESLFVSVYATNSKINLIHYLYGHLFYILMALSTTIPILFSTSSNQYSSLTILDNLLTVKRAIIFVLFVYVSLNQHRCHKILANLRKDKAGQVITDRHFVPSGGLFEYVSCPHFLLEVLLYLLVITAQNFSVYYWNLIFLLVLSSQTINALIFHGWYKKEYKEYPPDRRAIIPYLL